MILMVVLTQTFFHKPPLAGFKRRSLAEAVQERGEATLKAVLKKDGPRTVIEVGDDDARRKLDEAANVQRLADEVLEQGPIWPVLLAGAAFLYLWWLAIVTFDLTFIWHLYVRWALAQTIVKDQLDGVQGDPPRLRKRRRSPPACNLPRRLKPCGFPVGAPDQPFGGINLYTLDEL